MGDMAEVTIDKERGIITKRVLDNEWTRIDAPFPRERFWMRILSGRPHFPVLMSAGDGILVMDYCGEMVRAATMPGNWKEQAEEILATLDDVGCAHNDIKPDDILVKDGVLYLIDFNWSTIKGVPIPKGWPEALGCKFRAPWGYDDRWSLYISILSVMTGMRPNQLHEEMNRVCPSR